MGEIRRWDPHVHTTFFFLSFREVVNLQSCDNVCGAAERPSRAASPPILSRVLPMDRHRTLGGVLCAAPLAVVPYTSDTAAYEIDKRWGTALNVV